MSLLRPSSSDTEEPVLGERGTRTFRPEIELLRKSGIIKNSDGIEGHFIDAMHEVGLTPHSILARIASVMNSGESDGVKLSAAKMALQLYMHPAIVPAKVKEEQQRPNITFVIQSPQVNMQNVLAPGGNFGQNPTSW